MQSVLVCIHTYILIYTFVPINKGKHILFLGLGHFSNIRAVQKYQITSRNYVPSRIVDIPFLLCSDFTSHASRIKPYNLVPEFFHLHLVFEASHSTKFCIGYPSLPNSEQAQPVSGTNRIHRCSRNHHYLNQGPPSSP